MAQKSGFNSLARRFSRQRLRALCYHSVVSDDTPLDPRANIAVTASQFELQLRELTACFTPVSAEQVMAAFDGGQPLPPRALLVTFDDGYRNNLELAAPLLLKYGVPAFFFITTGLVGTRNLLWTQEIVERVIAWPATQFVNNPFGITDLPREELRRIEIGRSLAESCKRISTEHRQELLESMRIFDLAIKESWQRELYDFMTWGEVRQLKKLGFEVGAHTVTHPILTSLTQQALCDELAIAKEQIERELGTHCNTIAYPNGGEQDVSAAIFKTAGEAGYLLGFTLGGRVTSEFYNPLAIPRTCITRDISFPRFQLQLAGF